MMWCVAAWHISFFETGLLVQRRRAGLPAAGNDLRDGITFTGVTNRRGQHLVERQLAEAIVQLGPAVDAAGHQYTQRPMAWDELQVAAFELFEREAARAAAARIEAVELLRLRVPNDREQVAAQAAAHGFSYT